MRYQKQSRDVWDVAATYYACARVLIIIMYLIPLSTILMPAHDQFHSILRRRTSRISLMRYQKQGRAVWDAAATYYACDHIVIIVMCLIPLSTILMPARDQFRSILRRRTNRILSMRYRKQSRDVWDVAATNYACALVLIIVMCLIPLSTILMPARPVPLYLTTAH